MRGWGPAVTVFAATAGRPMATRSVAVMAGLALPAAVLFGPQGLSPAEVARWFDHFASVRAAFVAVAAVITAPVLAPSLVAPGTAFCRSLPVPRGQWISLTAASALAVQAPALLLFCAAGAMADAGAFGCSAAAAALTLAAGVADAWGIAAAVTASFAVIAGVPRALSMPLAAAMLALAARAAWTRAPEAVARHRSLPQLVGGPGWVALAVVHGLRLVRQGATTLVFWVPLAVGTGLLAAVVVRNRADVAEPPPTVIVLLVATLPFVLVTGTTCQRVLDCERRLRWILDVTGTRRWQRHAAAATALSSVAAVAAWLVAASAVLTAAPASRRSPISATCRSTPISRSSCAGRSGSRWSRLSSEPASLRRRSVPRSGFRRLPISASGACLSARSAGWPLPPAS